MQQLLGIETIVFLAGGLALSLIPHITIGILGLPETATGFWPRIFGAVLLGLAAATFIEGYFENSRGLGMAGCIVVNLAVAAMIATLNVIEAGAPTRRGRLILWLLVAFLVLLSLIEIAYL